MLNDGCGLCLELAHDDKTNRSLYIRVEVLQDEKDIRVRDTLAPYVVATPDTDTSWSWGHYFATFNDAYDYLMKGEI